MQPAAAAGLRLRLLIRQFVGIQTASTGSAAGSSGVLAVVRPGRAPVAGPVGVLGPAAGRVGRRAGAALLHQVPRGDCAREAAHNQQEAMQPAVANKTTSTVVGTVMVSTVMVVFSLLLSARHGMDNAKIAAVYATQLPIIGRPSRLRQTPEQATVQHPATEVNEPTKAIIVATENRGDMLLSRFPNRVTRIKASGPVK